MILIIFLNPIITQYLYYTYEIVLSIHKNVVQPVKKMYWYKLRKQFVYPIFYWNN